MPRFVIETRMACSMNGKRRKMFIGLVGETNYIVLELTFWR